MMPDAMCCNRKVLILGVFIQKNVEIMMVRKRLSNVDGANWELFVYSTEICALLLQGN